MQTRISVALNDIALHSLDGRIILQGIDEQTPSWNIQAQSRAIWQGQYQTGTEKRYREVIVKFAIREIRNMDDRARILQRIAGWAAQGGDLKLSYRMGQRLRVVCAALPTVQGIEQWANIYQITFRAYEIPDWINVAADAVTVTGATGTATLPVSANGGGKLEIEAENTSGSECGTITVTANTRSMSFTSLGLAAGAKFILSYDAKDIQQLTAGGVSCIGKRTTESDDDILLNSGSNTIGYSTAGNSIKWTFRCYGRWIG